MGLGRHNRGRWKQVEYLLLMGCGARMSYIGRRNRGGWKDAGYVFVGVGVGGRGGG